jgi:hypothetical protein
MSINGRKQTMNKSTLEERVAALERQVAELREVVTNGNQTKDWRRTIGMFAGDEVMKEIFDEPLKYRQEDRERFYRQYDKRQRVKKR